MPGPGWRDLRATLFDRIQAGTYPTGAALPGEAALATEFGAARATVNRAMRALADEGLIERKRRAGSRVRESPLRRATFPLPSLRDAVEATGSSYRYELLERGDVAAPDWLAARLALPAGTPMHRVVARHLADAAPVQIEERWVQLAVLPGAATAPFDRVSPTDWLVRAIPFSTVELAVLATRADAGMAAWLGTADGAALLTLERATWWQAAPVTFVRLTHREGWRMETRY